MQCKKTNIVVTIDTPISTEIMCFYSVYVLNLIGQKKRFRAEGRQKDLVLSKIYHKNLTKYITMLNALTACLISHQW